MNKLIINSLILALLLLTHQSFADDDEQSGSNIENFSYPAHTCNRKPEKPKKPGKFSPENDVAEYNNDISRYNIDVASYNENLKSYKACINQYIKNGNQDINTIREQLNSALKEARAK